MAERLAQGTEVAGVTTIILIWTSAAMDWLNDNHLAVISIVTIITGIVTTAAALYRWKSGKREDVRRDRELVLYEEEVKARIRRKEDKG